MTLREAILTSLTFALTSFEALVITFIVFFPYIPDPGFSVSNADLYAFLALLSPMFLLGVLYAWLARLATGEARRRSPRFRSMVWFLSEPFRKTLSSVKTVSLSDSAHALKILSRPKLTLGISLVVSALLAFVPYRPDLNPTGNLVGIDSWLYVDWISQMLARPVVEAIQYSFVGGLEGSRPLPLVLLYVIASAGVSPSTIIEFLPMILALFLSLSSYVFVRFGQGSAGLAGLTALFTSISFYTTVGMWGGYYANWLALVEVYLFLTCLLIFSRAPSAIKYVSMYVLSVAVFLTHPWTWVLITSVCLVFVISLWRETRSFVHVKSMVGVIVTGIVLDVLKSWAFATRTVAVDLATKAPSGVGSLAGFWNNMVDALLYTHGGLLGNWIFLGLALLATFALRFKDWFERILILWAGVASVPFVMLDSYHESRIVYDLPIPVLMSVAVLFFVPLIVRRNIRWPGLLILLVLIIGTTYDIQGLLLL
jgi:hypothetical protein